MKKISTFFFLMCMFLCLSLPALAQGIRITGKVIDKTTGTGLSQTSVTLVGTNQGTSSDASGNFTITVPSTSSSLSFSAVGYKATVLSVQNQTNLTIELTQDIGNLEEVVVVGYGTQKRATVTGAISSVKASDLETMPVNRVEQSLQGRTSGVTVTTSSGQPGSGASVRVRGITSLNNNNPLWVVDGVVVDNGGIGYLNQSDIATMDVLKDAAAQAIYGARAAAGVILITTKKGTANDLRINYNGYAGVAAPAKKLNLLNGTDYATLRNEALTNDGKAKIFDDPASFGQGTDWQKEIFNNSAFRHNHEFSMSGGSDKASVYTSFGYLSQEGIVATDISKYRRMNFRINTTFKPAPWLTLGENIGYARDKAIGLGNTNSEFGGPLSSAINLDPLTPAIVTDPAQLAQSRYQNAHIVRDPFGNPYGISEHVGQEMSNPLAFMRTRQGNYNWSDNIVGNVYAEVSPIEGLKFRSSLGAKLAFWGAESFTPPFYLNSSTINARANFSRNMNRSMAWNVENTISYTKSIADHTFTVLGGQGAYMDDNNYGIDGTYFGMPARDFNSASMNFSLPSNDRVFTGSEGIKHTVASYFARLNYNYKERYILEGLVRRDGSSRFGSSNKYGTFPSFSAGWVTSLEDFWGTDNPVSFLKIRGGYGVVGNDNIGNFGYTSVIGSGRNYPFGNEGGYLIGNSPNSPANSALKWEQTASTSIGFDAVIFNDFNLTVDWYNKKTTDILQNVRIPSYLGYVSDPTANVASMTNKGIEIELGYKKKFGELNFGVNGNVSYLKNRVTYLGDGIEYLSNGQSFQSTSFPITRTALGQSIFEFYGFKTDGIFQSQAEIDQYVNANGGKIQPNAAPGDFKWMKQIIQFRQQLLLERNLFFLSTMMESIRYLFRLGRKIEWAFLGQIKIWAPEKSRIY